jgi:triacylglycerol esterase/lipase EstA (alpha/beta hydrolase family)
MRPDLRGLLIATSMGLLLGCANLEAEELGNDRADPGHEEPGRDEPGRDEPGPSPDTTSDEPNPGIPDQGATEEVLASTAASRTPLPIVLLHGAAGFDRIGPLEYFFDIADTLEDDGQLVFTTQVDPLQRIDVRADQLADQIDAILAETGANRVHLIGHSQGGLDARFLISSLGYGDRVATLTTISTPHNGSRVADIALGLLPGGAEEVLAFLIDLLVGSATGSDQDVRGQIEQLTERYAINVFNPTNPDDPQVAYYSVAGVTQTNPFANPFTRDLCDPLLLVGYLLLRPTGANDGLVTVESARHGTFLGTIPADHLDEVGQLFGTTALAFSHRAFFRDLARFLTDPTEPSPI